MRVTVIPEDKVIIIDGRVLHLIFTAPAGLHALQWQGENGWLEFNDGQPNQALATEDFDTAVKPFVEVFQAEATRLDSCPGPAHEWDEQAGQWVYRLELDSPGGDYSLIDGRWIKVRFSKKDFLLLCGIPQVAALNGAINAGNLMAKTIHDLLFAAEYIDVTDPATIQMVGLLASETAGHVLTQEQAATILQGVPHVAEG